VINSLRPELDNLTGVPSELRKTIKAAAPEAEEIISYNMPAYKQKGD